MSVEDIRLRLFREAWCDFMAAWLAWEEARDYGDPAQSFEHLAYDLDLAQARYIRVMEAVVEAELNPNPTAPVVSPQSADRIK